MKEEKVIDYAQLKSSLEMLGCPYISSLQDDSIKELLFRPGEARLRFFQWLVSQVSPNIEAELNRPVLTAQIKDSKVQRLLNITSELGFCGRNDYELIQGNAGVQRQLRFYVRLMDSLEVKSTVPQNQDLSQAENMYNLANQDSLDCHNLIKDLTSSVAFKDLFNSKLDLFPPGFVCFNKDHKKTFPSPAKLQDRAVTMIEELTEIQQKLAALQQKHEFEEIDPKRIEGSRRALGHTISTLNQLIASFDQSYNNDFKAWTDRPEMTLNEVGPLCKKVDEEISKVLEYLGSVRSLNESMAQISDLDLNARMNEPLLGPDLQDLGDSLRTLQVSLEQL